MSSIFLDLPDGTLNYERGELTADDGHNAVVLKLGAETIGILADHLTRDIPWAEQRERDCGAGGDSAVLGCYCKRCESRRYQARHRQPIFGKDGA